MNQLLTQPHRISWPTVVRWAAATLFGVLLAGSFHFPGDFGTLRWSQVSVGLGSGVVGFIFGAVSGLRTTV